MAISPRNAATATSLGHWTTHATRGHTVVVHGLHPGGSDCSSMFQVANATATPHSRAAKPAKAVLTHRM